MSTSNDDTVSRVVVITGGGTGIGRCTARAFADEGAKVLVVGRTEATLLETAKDYDGIHALAVDITRRDAPGMIVDAALREFGRIDVLVNNAAIAGFGRLGELDRDQVEAQLGTNLFAPIFLTQQALGALEATGGTVVNLSTAGSLGLRSWPGNAPYGAGKVAIDFLTRTWAVELAPRGIRVVGVAPGVIDTGVGVRAGMSAEQYAEFLEQMSSRIPVGRVGDPDEIARWIVHLTRPGSAYVNGTVLALDGGLSVT